MYQHIDKPREKCNTNLNVKSGESNDLLPSPFTDNRPATILQRRLQETANNTPNAIKMGQLQAMANATHPIESIQKVQVKNKFTSVPIALPNNYGTIQMMKIVPIDGNKFQAFDDNGKEIQVYDPSDSGDLQKLIELFVVLEEPFPKIVIDALEKFNSIVPTNPSSLGNSTDDQMNEEEDLSYLQENKKDSRSTVEQREAAKQIILSFGPYSSELIALDRIEAQLKQLAPFLTPSSTMYDDDDPMLGILTFGFATILDNIKKNKKLLSMFEKAKGLQVQSTVIPGYTGAVKGRTFINYLMDCQTDCAQAAQGEMNEWFERFARVKENLED